MTCTNTHQLLAQEHIIKGPAHYRTTAPGNRGNPGPQGRHYQRRRAARAIPKDPLAVFEKDLAAISSQD
jgi:hypothetical protein